MKKTGNILYWIFISAAVLIIAYFLYNRFKPAQLTELPKQNVEERDKAGDAAETKENTGGTEENTTGPTAENEKEQQMAPDFTLKDLEGKDVKLSDYRGKIVVLNFWALWCPYCVEELPDFEKIHKEFQKTGDVVVVTVNLQDDPGKIEEFMKEKKLTFPVLLDRDGKVGYTYGTSEGIPQTFFINRDGSAYGYIPGKTDAKTVLEVVEKIK